MSIKINEQDAIEIANIIAKQAAAELKSKNPLMMMKTAGISIADYNMANDEVQDELINKAENVCIENLASEFKDAIISNPKDFFTKHTELFDEAELDLEEYLIKE